MADDYSEVIKLCEKEINNLFKGKGWEDDEKVTQLYQLYFEAIYAQVHNYLVPKKTEKAEKEIRKIIAQNVIGYSTKRKVYIGSLDPIRAKIIQIDKNKTARNEYIARYVDLYDDFMALASFRSYKHYCIYMQSCFNFTLWEDTQNVFNGYWYYANKMVLDGEVKFMEKQLPTGYGKSLSDSFMIAWLLGVDIDNDVFKVCGNDKFTDDCFINVTDRQMLTPKYAKVFPYFSKFKCQPNLMFSIKKDLKFAITGSKKSTNLRIVTKLSDTNGVRAKFLFLDDITQRRDMANITQHNKDIHSFTHEWFERNYNRNQFFVVASGTTYSQFDLLSHLRRVMGGEKTKQSAINKYTSLAFSDYIVPNGLSVFICVPLLDYETDESTYPQKISTISARKKRDENLKEFMAMDQQRPLPPDDSPFYYTVLREYETLPEIGTLGRSECCCASLDPKRRGKDFLSMPIAFETDDPENKNNKVFFIKDWLYSDKPMKDCIPFIISKIIQHNITRLYVERNTEECIATMLKDKLAEQNFNGCIIDEVYSTEQKDRRIMESEGYIKSNIIFPKFGMFSPASDMGKALLNVYGYTYTGKVVHDDAPDSLALFTKKFIIKRNQKYAQVITFHR